MTPGAILQAREGLRSPAPALAGMTGTAHLHTYPPCSPLLFTHPLSTQLLSTWLSQALTGPSMLSFCVS